MNVYRLCRAKFKGIDGIGAQIHGGRWNNPGRRVVYTSESIALAALEVLVNISARLAPTDLIALTLEIPDDLRWETVDLTRVPSDWYRYPDSVECRSLGDEWIAASISPALRVPSAPVPEEHNYLISPTHPDAGRIRVVGERPFSFDSRLFK